MNGALGKNAGIGWSEHFYWRVAQVSWGRVCDG